MADDTAPQVDMQSHVQTYHAVLKGAAALMLSTIFVLVALTMFAFGSGTSATVYGFLGLIFGTVGLVVDSRTGSGRWTVSLIILALFVAVTLMKVAA
ncbi:hypothetical protein FHS85_003802 [Rhodoligotrophos appendicifer]|uniref:hypothetical protein n=1 Tax=Rhodoligotrophos appendicifer TaxID=987056 RepID=UPI0011847478|nr:hypothetical protein [Rhodoligotrophos appendicifer]